MSQTTHNQNSPERNPLMTNSILPQAEIACKENPGLRIRAASIGSGPPLNPCAGALAHSGCTPNPSHSPSRCPRICSTESPDRRWVAPTSPSRYHFPLDAALGVPAATKSRILPRGTQGNPAPGPSARTPQAGGMTLRSRIQVQPTSPIPRLGAGCTTGPADNRPRPPPRAPPRAP